MITKISALQCAIIALQMIFNIHLGTGLPLLQISDLAIPLDVSPVTGRLDDVCTTLACNKTASEVLGKMDFKVDPCDDFYGFACGTFRETTIIPDDETMVDLFIELNAQVQKQLRVIIEKPSSPKELKSFRLVKDLYKTCMNETAIEEQGSQPLLEILKKLGGWPVLDGDEWNDSKFDWINTTLVSNEIGFNVDSILNIGIDFNRKNNTRYVLYLDQGSPSYYSATKSWMIYENHMIDVAVALGATKESAKHDFKNTVDFEKKLNEILLPSEKRRNHTILNNLMTISDLNQRYPSIPWGYYLNGILSPNIQIDNEELLMVKVPEYIGKLEKLMIETPKRTIANFLNWKVVESSLPHLNTEMVMMGLNFSSQISGQKKTIPRWKKCINIINRHLPLAIGALYVRNQVDHDMKKKANEMVKEIRNQFDKILRNVDWMDNQTKKSALDKVASMSSQIAFPEELLNDSKLEKFYKKVDLFEGNYLRSLLNLVSFSWREYYNSLKKPVDKKDWTSFVNPTTINAFLSRAENTLIIPAGILQGSFFSTDRPMYMNYGAIGSIIGHEITHGFDDQGRQYDEKGNLVDWWAPVTDEKYRQKIQCIIDQYSNYTVEEIGMKVNGFKTQGENIADNGGIKMAYLAYKDWSAKNKPEPKLHGLDFSPEQMFWISTASTWCSKERIESMKIRQATDRHSPDEFRIIGPFSNIPEFAKDFDCPVDSKMNPKKKCDLW